MDLMVAQILVRNFLSRLFEKPDGRYVLDGSMTGDERKALELLAGIALGSVSSTNNGDSEKEGVAVVVAPEAPQIHEVPAVDELCLKSLDATSMPSDARVCYDFGTAMSKVSLVIGDDVDEEIHVLELGIHASQQDVSETMLVSSVYIDVNGLMWFGQEAVARSQAEILDGSRERLDNIKRWLSEGDIDDLVSEARNPSGVQLTYRDLLLAYLTFMTGIAASALAAMGLPGNIRRRFALPCLPEERRAQVASQMATLLGQAQILADTFNEAGRQMQGMPAETLYAFSRGVARQSLSVPFIEEAVEEPLAVAGSLISWTAPVNNLALVIDVGAGTTDFSMYRMRVITNDVGDVLSSHCFQVEGSSDVVRDAGAFLDMQLMILALRKSGIFPQDAAYKSAKAQLALDIKIHKESIFKFGEIILPIFGQDSVQILLDEFLEFPPVKDFAGRLEAKVNEILNRVPEAVINSAPNHVVAIVLTGGGASLPMVKSLTHGEVQRGGVVTKRMPSISPVPPWIQLDHPSLVQDYPQTSVSIGGARERILERRGVVSIGADAPRPGPILPAHLATS